MLVISTSIIEVPLAIPSISAGRTSHPYRKFLQDSEVTKYLPSTNAVKVYNADPLSNSKPKAGQNGGFM